MSDTPRTEIYVLNPMPEAVPAEFARELERENQKLRAALESIATHAGTMTNDEALADSLLRGLTVDMMHRAECFDYLCWLEETHQSEKVKDAKFLVLASDWTTCWGDTVEEAVRAAMKHDKELWDAVKAMSEQPTEDE